MLSWSPHGGILEYEVVFGGQPATFQASAANFRGFISHHINYACNAQTLPHRESRQAASVDTSFGCEGFCRRIQAEDMAGTHA